jgi:hypothetical protein
MAEKLDSKTVDALDKLFNAWLALNGIISQGGALYKADAKGTILLNSQQQRIKVDPQQFKILMNDSTHGFQAFVAKKGIHVKTIQREFPEQK